MHNILISKKEVDDLVAGNKHLHGLCTRLINEIQVARAANKMFKQEMDSMNMYVDNLKKQMKQQHADNDHLQLICEVVRKENDLLRDIRYEYEYSKKVAGSFAHESPI